MDVFYEESSIAQNARKESRKYRILQIISNILLVLGFFSVFISCNILPIKDFLIWTLMISLWFFVSWFVLFKLKNRYNVNYDYAFVSGELRIARVINTTKRKAVVRLQPEDIIQIGDIDNTAFAGFQADPNVKKVYCTSNVEAAEGKFFMYILANDNGKKLYVLECREELLMHILRFVKRTTLESDYVSQEKKQAKKI